MLSTEGKQTHKKQGNIHKQEAKTVILNEKLHWRSQFSLTCQVEEKTKLPSFYKDTVLLEGFGNLACMTKTEGINQAQKNTETEASPRFLSRSISD